MSNNEYQEYEIGQSDDQQVNQPRSNYKSKKALQARLANLAKGREKRQKLAQANKMKKEIKYYDDDDEDYSDEDYSESESDSEPEDLVITKKKKLANKNPTKNEIKVMKKLHKIEKFINDLSSVKHSKGKGKRRTVNKTLVMPVYPSNQPNQQAPHKLSENDRNNLLALF
jgi:hypothetical protein